jgi:hypothetical protein
MILMDVLESMPSSKEYYEGRSSPEVAASPISPLNANPHNEDNLETQV